MSGHLYLWLIPALPFAGFLLNGIFGARLPKPLVTAIGLIAPLAAFGVVVKRRGYHLSLRVEVLAVRSSELRLEHSSSRRELWQLDQRRFATH